MNEIDEIILKMIQDDYPHRNICFISVLENNDRYFVTYRYDNQYQWGSDVIKKPFENPEVNPQDGTVKGVYIVKVSKVKQLLRDSKIDKIND